MIPGCVGFKSKDNGLLPITVDKFGPWIFVNLGFSLTGTRAIIPVNQNDLFCRACHIDF